MSSSPDSSDRRRGRPPADALHPLGPADAEPAATILAHAFHTDPFFTWLLPDDATRLAWLTHFMRANVWLARRDDGRLVTRPAAGADVSGTILAYPPGAYPNHKLDELRFLSRIVARGLGKVPFDRIGRGLRVFKDMAADHPKAPHWYISVLGVAPTAQGRGLGRTLVEAITRQADEAGVPTWLETSLPANLGFYGHIGFDVQAEWTWDGVPTVWGLMRPA